MYIFFYGMSFVALIFLFFIFSHRLHAHQAMLDTLATKRPPLAVLENVVGILRFLPHIERAVKRKLPGYYAWWLRICPTQLGHAVRRPRIYFILCRQDLCVVQDHCKLGSLQQEIFSALQRPLKAPLIKRLLPRCDPRVQSFLEARAKRKVSKASETGILNTYQLTRREATVLNHTWKKRRVASLVADVSQGCGRVPHASHGLCPTLTPGGHCVVVAADRCIIPEEKLLLGGVPLHKLDVPKCLTSTQLASLGGNLMHVEAVAACILLGLAVLRPQEICARSPQCTWSMMPQTFIGPVPSKPSRDKAKARGSRSTKLQRKPVNKERSRLGNAKKGRGGTQTSGLRNVYKKAKPGTSSCFTFPKKTSLQFHSQDFVWNSFTLERSEYA